MSVLAGRLLLAAALLGTVGSTLWNYPHQLAYFNELAGGPYNGWRHLLGSSLDWGQDVALLYETVSSDATPRVLTLGLFTAHADIYHALYPGLVICDEFDLDARTKRFAGCDLIALAPSRTLKANLHQASLPVQDFSTRDMGVYWILSPDGFVPSFLRSSRRRR